MKEIFTIKNNSGKDIEITGVALLRLMNEITQTVIEKYRNQNAKKNNGTFKIADGRSWLDTVGHLDKNISRYQVQSDFWLSCTILVGANHISTIKTTQQNNGAIVVFSKNKGSYQEITTELLSIITTTHLTHNMLATQLLQRIKIGKYSYPFSEQHRSFLDTLLVLMFGVESSRNNTTILTSLFLLDLIASEQVYGRRNTPFDWNCAFVSRHGYRWDDWENNNYGGKYPMSQQSTGTGNLGIGASASDTSAGVLQYGRAHFLKIADSMDIETTNGTTQTIPVYRFEEIELMDNFIKRYPQRHSVPKREISLAIHWLESLTSHEYEILKQAEHSLELHNNIKSLFENRLLNGYCLSNTPDKHREWLKVPNNNPLLSRTQFFAKDIATNCFSYKHSSKLDNNQMTEFGDHKTFLFHRADVRCKLIPGWITLNETKAINDKGTKKVIKAEKSDSIDQTNTKQCEYCYSRPYPAPSKTNF